MRSLVFGVSLSLIACGSSGGAGANGGAASVVGSSGSGQAEGGASLGGKEPAASGGAAAGGSGGTLANGSGGAGTGVPSGGSAGTPVPTDLVPADVTCTPGPIKQLAVGKWTALGPPSVAMAMYGLVGVTVDPSNPSTLYVAMQDNGIWKSCDGGTSWMQLGKPGSDPQAYDNVSNFLDVPFEIAVDPSDSMHLYATVGVRGAGGVQGFYVSHNGGSIWVRPEQFAALATSTTGYDTTDFAVDPKDFNHVLVAFHSPWKNMMNAGIVETKDGGVSWTPHPPQPEWTVGTNGIEFLYDPVAGVGDDKTWLNMTGAGFWRTKDAGETWTKVSDFGEIHGLDVVHRAKSGALYAGGFGYPQRSMDNGLSWSQVKGAPYANYYVVMGDGKTLFSSNSGTAGNTPVQFFSSADSDGLTWSKYGGTDQIFNDGAITMSYDAKNHILYAAAWKAGVLAIKTQ